MLNLSWAWGFGDVTSPGTSASFSDSATNDDAAYTLIDGAGWIRVTAPGTYLGFFDATFRTTEGVFGVNKVIRLGMTVDFGGGGGSDADPKDDPEVFATPDISGTAGHIIFQCFGMELVDAPASALNVTFKPVVTSTSAVALTADKYSLLVVKIADTPSPSGL